MTFKIGQRVRVKDEPEIDNIHKGKEGDVVNLSVESIYDVYVAVNMSFDSEPIPFFNKELEPVQ